jgi:hypothetical protein
LKRISRRRLLRELRLPQEGSDAGGSFVFGVYNCVVVGTGWEF